MSTNYGSNSVGPGNGGLWRGMQPSAAGTDALTPAPGGAVGAGGKGLLTPGETPGIVPGNLGGQAVTDTFNPGDVTGAGDMTQLQPQNSPATPDTPSPSQAPAQGESQPNPSSWWDGGRRGAATPAPGGGQKNPSWWDNLRSALQGNIQPAQQQSYALGNPASQYGPGNLPPGVSRYTQRPFNGGYGDQTGYPLSQWGQQAPYSGPQGWDGQGGYGPGQQNPSFWAGSPYGQQQNAYGNQQYGQQQPYYQTNQIQQPPQQQAAAQPPAQQSNATKPEEKKPEAPKDPGEFKANDRWDNMNQFQAEYGLSPDEKAQWAQYNADKANHTQKKAAYEAYRASNPGSAQLPGTAQQQAPAPPSANSGGEQAPGPTAYGTTGQPPTNGAGIPLQGTMTAQGRYPGEAGTPWPGWMNWKWGDPVPTGATNALGDLFDGGASRRPYANKPYDLTKPPAPGGPGPSGR